ncbi:hypothetical protein VTN31DRAFT_6816 [Thermomyces dupontii]|uniref:uncharacterized protein n=1 Tax=Talaromyces thermophilus TaxID=28565 RepID=UPI0037424FA7
MGWFDGASVVSSRSHRSSSGGYFVRKRSPSGRSTVYYTTHPRHSSPAVFNLGSHSNRSSASIFSSSSSSRRARPRSGFVQRIISRIRRLLRDIYRYARKHPIKTFLLVIVPLITAGILPRLLAAAGIRLPRGLIRQTAKYSSAASSTAGTLSDVGKIGGSLAGLVSLAKVLF